MVNYFNGLLQLIYNKCSINNVILRDKLNMINWLAS